MKVKRKKVYTPRGLVVGTPAWTHDHKPGVLIKHKSNYDVADLDDVVRQVYEELGIERRRV